MTERMSLRRLEMFVAVAEELHFTRAAKRLFMSQPPLTRQIRALEEKLNVELFERGTRSVSLTRAGEVLLREARNVIGAYEVALRETLRAANVGPDSLVLGCVESVRENLLPRVMSRFCDAYPHVSVEVMEGHTRKLERAVIAGTIDCAILRPPVENDHLEVDLLYTEPLVAVVPTDFPKINRGRVRFEDLRHVPFVLFERSLGTGVAHALNQSCLDAGFVPKVSATASSTAMLLGLVAAGRGISLLPESYRLTTPYGVTMVPLDGEGARCGLAVVRRTDVEDDAVRRDLLDIIGEAAAEVTSEFSRN